jgi:hypothetical protein
VLALKPTIANSRGTKSKGEKKKSKGGGKK